MEGHERLPDLFGSCGMVVSDPIPKRPDLWFVMAYYAPWNSWRIHDDLNGFSSKEAAEDHAKKLLRGWTHYQIVKIEGVCG